MHPSDSTRRNPVILFLVGAVLLTYCAVAAVFEKIDPIETRSAVVWRKPEEARRVAVETRRPMLFAFLRDRDLESSRLEHEVFGDAELGAHINKNFVAVRVVDVSRRGRRNSPFVTNLMTQFDVGRLPALVVADADGINHERLGRVHLRRDVRAFLDDAGPFVMRQKPRRDEARRAMIEALARIGSATSPTLSPDGTRVAFVSDLSGEPQLWAMDVENGFPERIHAAPWPTLSTREPQLALVKRMALPVDVITEVTVSADGTHMAFTGGSATQPSNIWLYDVKTKTARQLTRSSHAGVDLAKLVAPERVQGGWLYRAATPGRAVISVDGGPQSFNPAYQALVVVGISVFATNDDVQAAAEMLKREGIATRIGVIGAKRVPSEYVYYPNPKTANKVSAVVTMTNWFAKRL